MSMSSRGSRRAAAAVKAGTHTRAGFTLVELMVTVAIVGILAGLAIPNLRNVLMRARAADVAGNMEVVRVAVLSYHAEHLSFPAEAGPGTIPSGLEEFLPEGFSFTQNGYDLDYENWDLPGGLPGDPSTTTLVGVSVTTSDPSLSNAVTEVMGGAIVFSVGTTQTVVIDRS